jgi:hypothetical protein
MKSLHNTIEKLKMKLALERARSRMGQGDFQRAILIFSKLFSDYGTKEPSLGSPLIANILFADCCEGAGKSMDAYRVCELSISQIDLLRIDPNSAYNLDELNYLSYKCKWIISLLTKFNDSDAFKFANNIRITYNDINLKKVRSYIQYLLPIDEEVGRKLDNFFEDNQASTDGLRD